VEQQTKEHKLNTEGFLSISNRTYWWYEHHVSGYT